MRLRFLFLLLLAVVRVGQWACLITFLIACLSVSLTGCQTGGVAGSSSGDPRYVTLKIYHTNDIHAHLLPDGQGHGGFAYLASVLKLVREQDKSALVLDAGDMYKKGGMPTQVTHDQVTADLVSLMPYWDARAVGNNEVKVGVSTLIDWAKNKEKEPLLSANFVDAQNKTVFAPYTILSSQGLKIGIIGVTPPVPVEASVQPKNDPRAPYKILSPDEALPPVIKSLRPQVDILILLSHQNYRDNLRWAHLHPEIDLIVSGHSHFFSGDQKNMNGNMVVETGAFGRYLGVVTLVYDKQNKKVSALESTFWPIGVELQLPDPQMAKAVQEVYKKWAPDAFKQLGSANGDLSLIDVDHPYEGSLEDWAADVFCAKTKCDFAIVNRDMLLEDIKKGKISKETLYLVAPYEDKIASISISREKMIQMLKESIGIDYKKSGFVGYAFAKAKLTLVIPSTDKPGDLKVSLVTSATQPKINVALPEYVISHCGDFFSKRFCPLPKPETFGNVRESLETAVETAQKVSPPEERRVRVVTSDDE